MRPIIAAAVFGVASLLITVEATSVALSFRTLFAFAGSPGVWF